MIKDTSTDDTWRAEPRDWLNRPYPRLPAEPERTLEPEHRPESDANPFHVDREDRWTTYAANVVLAILAAGYVWAFGMPSLEALALVGIYLLVRILHAVETKPRVEQRGK